MRFVPCVLLNFKASAAESGIFHGLKTIFLESTVHKLSTNDLLVYQKTVHEDIQITDILVTILTCDKPLKIQHAVLQSST